MPSEQMEMFAPFPHEERRMTGAKFAPFTSEASKGNGAGANVRHSRSPDGARPAHPFPKTQASVAERKAEIKQYLRELSLHRTELQPSMDAYNSATANARDKLKVSHEQICQVCGCPQAEKRRRLSLHNDILNASETYGAAVIAYRENKRLIDSYVTELARLEEKKA